MKVAEVFDPVIVGTTKLKTKMVITVANIPSVRPSVLSFLNQEEFFLLIDWVKKVELLNAGLQIKETPFACPLFNGQQIKVFSAI